MEISRHIIGPRKTVARFRHCIILRSPTTDADVELARRALIEWGTNRHGFMPERVDFKYEQYLEPISGEPILSLAVLIIVHTRYVGSWSEWSDESEWASAVVSDVPSEAAGQLRGA